MLALDRLDLFVPVGLDLFHWCGLVCWELVSCLVWIIYWSVFFVCCIGWLVWFPWFDCVSLNCLFCMVD